MKYRALDLYAANEWGLVALAQLESIQSAAETARMIRDGLLIRVRPGVYRTVGSPTSFEQAIRAVQLSAPEALASHNTSLWLWDLIDDGHLDSIMHFTFPDDRTRRYPGVRTHRSDSPDRGRLHRGIRVTNPARSFIDSACYLGKFQRQDILERAIQLQRFTFAGLRNEITRLSANGRNGTGIVRELLDEYDSEDTKTRSPFERRTRRALLAAGLPEPVRELEVKTSNTTRFVDFAYPEIRLGIEVDSRAYHSRLRDFDKDRLRTGELLEAGIEIFPVTKANFDEAIARIVRIYRDRTARL